MRMLTPISPVEKLKSWCDTHYKNMRYACGTKSLAASVNCPCRPTLLRTLFLAMESHLVAVLELTHQDESEESGTFVLNRLQKRAMGKTGSEKRVITFTALWVVVQHSLGGPSGSNIAYAYLDRISNKDGFQSTCLLLTDSLIDGGLTPYLMSTSENDWDRSNA